jgi:hypothetical protein
MHFSIGVAACACLLLAFSINASILHVRDDTIYPNPNEDPFYQAPSNISTFRPGAVIRSRAVNTTIGPKNAKASFQVLYRTTDTQNQSEATVATLWAPYNPRQPAQILSYHSYMDSDSFDCSPSWAWLNNTKSNGWVPLFTDAKMFINWALQFGLYVLDPDDEGPKATFIAGFQQGQAALDGMRATRDFFGLPKDTEIGMTGYSGGASVTAWAVNLSERYAPDLNIIGAAYGGTPIDTRSMFNFLNGGPIASFAGAGLIGLMSAYPEMNKFILDHVDEKSTKLIDKYRGRNQCIQNVVLGNFFVDFYKLINVTDPLNTPIIKSVLNRETLFMNVSTVGVSSPKFPRMIWHGTLDFIVPFKDEEIYVDQQCQHGANIQFNKLKFREHALGEFTYISQVQTYLGQIFNKTTPVVQCGQGAPSMLTKLLSREEVRPSYGYLKRMSNKGRKRMIP